MTANADDLWSRPNFKTSDKKAFLFYLVFGVDNIELTLSKSEHNISGLAEEINIINYSKDKSDEHKSYIEGFYSDNFGNFLKQKDQELYKQTIACNSMAIIQLEIDDQPDLEYLRNTTGLIQCILEQGAVSVFDMQTIS